MSVEFAVLRPYANHWEERNTGLEFPQELDYCFFGQGLKDFSFAVLCLVEVTLTGVSTV